MPGNAGWRLRPGVRPQGIMLTDFYISFSALCFTLLGLWLVVLQSRMSQWQATPMYRRRSYGIAPHFSLPGMMSLLALVDSQSSGLRRASFAIVALGGAAVLVAVRGPAPDRLGLTVAPVRVEGILLCRRVSDCRGHPAQRGADVRAFPGSVSSG
jgi:hypothetical protein